MTSWGRLTQPLHDISYLEDRHQLLDLKGHTFGLPYGMGRSYGDVCFNTQGLLWQTTGLNRLIAFEKSTGRFYCEAGVLLKDIQRFVVPHGWILPVTPGTQWVTVGGAIANDVHGKNHTRRGTFGTHIRKLRLARTDGTVLTCSQESHADWLRATIGGIGLTGVILDAEIQLQPIQSPWLKTQMIPFDEIVGGFALLKEAASLWEYTVVWLDCTRLGSGLLMQARWSDEGYGISPKSNLWRLPALPASVMNRFSLKPLNWLYYQAKKRVPEHLHYEAFFYPLDNVVNWNQLYGPSGFYQYQVVLPQEDAEAVLKAMMRLMQRFKQPSSLAVLKIFSDETPAGMMSFAKKGITLALDFPNQGERTRRLLKQFDDIVLAAQGRLYLAKDACMSRDVFESGYANINAFLKYKDSKIRSDLYQRLMG